MRQYTILALVIDTRDAVPVEERMRHVHLYFVTARDHIAATGAVARDVLEGWQLFQLAQWDGWIEPTEHSNGLFIHHNLKDES